MSSAVNASAIALIMAVAAPAFAETARDATNQTLGQDVRDKQARSVANGQNDSPLKAGKTGMPEFQLIVTEKENVGSMAVTLGKGGSLSDNSLVTQNFIVRAYGKLNKGEGLIGGLDGFVGNAGIELSYIRYSTRVNTKGLASDLTDSADLLTATKACQLTNHNLEGKELAQKCGDGTLNGLPSGGYALFLETYNNKAYVRLIEKNFGGTSFWGLSAGINQSEFDFIDRAKFAADSVSRVGASGSVFGGWLGQKLDWSFSGAFSYRRKFDAADDVTLCKALATAGLSQCLTGADGLPTRSEAALFSIEYRRKLGGTFAIAPRATFDVKSNDFSVDVPIYFAPDSDGALRGGIRGTFVSRDTGAAGRKDSFALSLFIGVPFSVFRQ